DVARWPHPLFGDIRVEHWTNAVDHGSIIAAGIMGRTPRPPQVPYAWSDQYGRRVQIAGQPGGSPALLEGGLDTADNPLTAVWTATDGRVTGALVVDNPRTFQRLSQAVRKGTGLDGVDLRRINRPLPRAV